MLAAYLTAPVRARHDDSVDRREHQETLRHQARRPHHVVDVLVIEPGAHLSVLGKRETFACACEAYARIVAAGRDTRGTPRARRRARRQVAPAGRTRRG